LGFDISDTEVLQLIRMGNRNAFNLVYNNYAGMLYNYGCRLSPDREMVKDSIQDVFIALWNRRDRLPEISSLKAYLLKSIRYTLQRKIRRDLSYSQRPDDVEWFQIELSSEARIVDDETAAEISERLRKCVNMLPTQQREVIFHIFYHKMNYEETASVMALSRKSIYNLLHLGLQKLRMAMKNAPAICAFLIILKMLLLYKMC